MIAIIGAGPAGLYAAEIIAGAGHKVCVFDRKPSVGRKFLMAGRGGLNLTHSENIETFLPRYREQSGFLAPLIQSFSPQDLRAWCEALEQETFVGSSGRVFPKAMKASPLLRAWLSRLEKLSVEFKLGRTWKGWDKNGALLFQTSDGTDEAHTAQATLLALGGASWPNLGSDGSWVSILEKSGVDIMPLRPSNMGFSVTWSDVFKSRFAGQPLKTIAITLGSETVKGEMMIGKNGVEGGAVYALSAPIRDKIAKDGSATISIDLRPEMPHESIVKKLALPRGRQSFSTWIQKTLALSPLHTTLMREAAPDLATMRPDQVAALIKSLPLNLTAPYPIERAISTAGGIATSGIDNNMMIKKIPGVFVAGEMIDWEAPTGGYLLQACFATGAAAGKGILSYTSEKPA